MKGRWMAAGAVSFMVLEIEGLGYAWGLGRLAEIRLTPSMILAILIGMAVFGALFGLLFAFLHSRLPSWPIMQRAIFGLCVFGTILAIVVQGPGSVASSEFWVGLAMSVVAGAIFGWLGMKLGATGETPSA